ncbi:hypothetical protein [Bremerella cremea]|nr:hypothetical protein [Bremerella cremea]
MPFPPAGDLGLGQIETTPAPDSVVNDQMFKNKIYDEEWLVIEPEQLGGLSFSQFADQNLPLINRLLATVYIFDNVNGVYRYPGAIVTNENNEQTILIPVVHSDDTVSWVAPVEEMRVPDLGIGPFNIALNVPASSLPPNFEPGVVALRINYPYQSASMSGFGESSGTPPHRGNIGNPIIADDSALTEEDSGRYSLVVSDNDYVANQPNIHSGKFGLGTQGALPYENVREFGVRPYRKIISVQAIYRREVFAQ